MNSCVTRCLLQGWPAFTTHFKPYCPHSWGDHGCRFSIVTPKSGNWSWEIAQTNSVFPGWWSTVWPTACLQWCRDPGTFLQTILGNSKANKLTSLQNPSHCLSLKKEEENADGLIFLPLSVGWQWFCGQGDELLQKVKRKPQSSHPVLLPNYTTKFMFASRAPGPSPTWSSSYKQCSDERHCTGSPR